jgi:hypothetical protein
VAPRSSPTQTALASGFAPVANSDAEHTDLLALGNDLGFGLGSRLLLVLAVIWLDHVQANMILGSIGGKCNFRRDDHRNQTIQERLAGVRGSPGVQPVRNNSLVDLNRLISGNSEFTLTDSIAINNAGQILCNAKNSSGTQRAVLLTPK